MRHAAGGQRRAGLERHFHLGLEYVQHWPFAEKARALGYDAAATDREDWQKASFIESGNYKTWLRVVYDRATRRILGAELASSQDVSMGLHMFSLAIEQGYTIDQLKLLDIFFLPHFNAPYNYITMAALGAQ